MVSIKLIFISNDSIKGTSEFVPASEDSVVVSRDNFRMDDGKDEKEEKGRGKVHVKRI